MVFSCVIREFVCLLLVLGSTVVGGATLWILRWWFSQ